MLLILGTWVAVLPYLGFPSSWKNVLFTISGLGLIYYSYTLYHKDSKMKESQKRTFDNFRENHDFKENNTETTVEGMQEHKNQIEKI